jgi:hypothetical protein
MRLHSYKLPGPAEPSQPVLFPRLPVMLQVLSVSLRANCIAAAATGAALLTIADGEGTLIAAYVSESLSPTMDCVVVFAPGLLPDIVAGASSAGSYSVSSGYIPPALWLPPNWQLSIALPDADAGVIFNSANITFLSAE